MWKNLKNNWKAYLLALLTAAVGWLSGDKALEYSSAGPALADDNTWTVTTYLELDRVAGGGATPAVPYKDMLGREVLKIESVGKPTDAQVIAAYDPGLDPAKVRLVNPVYRKPGGKVEPVPDEPEKE